MVFNSLSFAMFMAVIFFIYWFIPYKYRWIVLLAANICFYLSFELMFFIVLLFETVVSYLFAFKLKNNRTLFAVSIIACLLPLLICKYLNFSIIVLSNIGLSFSAKTLQIMQPIGISFYTFEVISYLSDVFKGKTEAEKHLGYYACYVSFFGTISSGPIERAESFISQLGKEKEFEYQNGTRALKLLAWGLFKKIVIADNLACYVNNVYDNLYEYKGFILVIVILLYTIQIYCDFSGYSDMARGVAKLLGIDINTNFNAPYFSTTVKEFWRRWHISLTFWFRDYIYIPLGGNRKGTLKKYLNQIVVFFISGLWHGSNYTFILWGLIHAGLQIVEDALKIKPATKKSIVYYLRMVFVFLLISLVWVFFRADSVSDVVYIFRNMFVGITEFRRFLVIGLYSLDYEPLLAIAKITVNLIPLFLFDMFSIDVDIFERVSEMKPVTKYIMYIIFVLMILFLHNVGEVNFIYFKF